MKPIAWGQVYRCVGARGQTSPGLTATMPEDDVAVLLVSHQIHGREVGQHHLNDLIGLIFLTR